MKTSAWPGNGDHMAGVAVHPPSSRQEIPPRSRLYPLTPVGLGTVLVECLSSYINRLALAYRVNARILVAHEVLPLLSEAHYVPANPLKLGGFGRTRSMIVNGASAVAHDWAKTLGQLTMRSDLGQLTAHQWATGLPQWGLLRSVPQWCPLCYQQWREQGVPIYQPLLWALRAVTICVQHRTGLVEHCPSCHQSQSAIAAKSSPGSCTQCSAWLGEPPGAEKPVTTETLDWQTWVMDAIAECYHASRMFDELPWHALPIGIAACVKAVGGCRELARRVSVPNALFSAWQNRQRTPSLTYVLAVSYVLNLSPLQLMTVEPERLRERLWAKMVYRSAPDFKYKMPNSQGDSPSIQAFLQSVLCGEMGPLPLRLVARHLGVGEKYLVGRFPQECAEITAHYLAHRAVRAQERVAQECAEVKQAVFALREEGMIPTPVQIIARLSHPHMLRRPEAKATWSALQHEMEREQE
jgi:TniQ